VIQKFVLSLWRTDEVDRVAVGILTMIVRMALIFFLLGVAFVVPL
jgi:hypothetical protein